MHKQAIEIPPLFLSKLLIWDFKLFFFPPNIAPLSWNYLEFSSERGLNRRITVWLSVMQVNNGKDTTCQLILIVWRILFKSILGIESWAFQLCSFSLHYVFTVFSNVILEDHLWFSHNKYMVSLSTAAIGKYTHVNNEMPVANLKSSLVCNKPWIPAGRCQRKRAEITAPLMVLSDTH